MNARRAWWGGVIAVLFVALGFSASAQERTKTKPLTAEDRIAILRRAQVWTPTEIESVDVKAGPPGPGALSPGETVACDYVKNKMSGASPKFTCALSADDDVKVKFGQRNGEVYGEVAATRLLWALGFGADRMYPVKVICRGCPSKLDGAPGQRPDEFVFDPAAIERKASGKTIETHPDEGWSWKELDLVQEAAGGASPAQRDALKLLAVLMQHGDNKPQQQRLVCLDKAKDKGQEKKDASEPEPEGGELCLHPFMLVSDLGLTFGRVDILNRNSLEGVNFNRWVRTPIWKKDDGCIGNLPKSLSGSMHDPVIGEAGRQFLSDLLARLSDAQLHDLFEVARFPLRTGKSETQRVTIDNWISAFKAKREEIANRHCPE